MSNEEKDLFADLKTGDVKYFYFRDKTAHTGERILRVVRDGSGTLWSDKHGVGVRVADLAEPVICEVPHSTVLGTGYDQGFLGGLDWSIGSLKNLAEFVGGQDWLLKSASLLEFGRRKLAEGLKEETATRCKP